MKFIKIYILLLILVSVSCNSKKKTDIPVVKNGVLDLSNWNFEKDGNIKLDGEWEFYPYKFIKSEKENNDSLFSKNFIKVPGTWNNFEIILK